ncbi:MAG: DUF6089 family protein [Aureispira sp.]
MRQLLLIGCALLLMHPLQAQYWEVGATAGATTYHGDLAPDFSMQAPGMSASIMVHRNVDPRVSIRMGLSMGTISASDALSSNPFNKARNLSFQSTIFEGSLGIEFNFLPFHHHSLRSRNVNQYTPYLIAGVGMFHHKPQARLNGSLYSLQPLGTEGQVRGEEYSLIQPAFILGAGFKIDVGAQWGIVIEGATRLLFFDYLDDVSGNYADPRVIASNRGSLGSSAVALADRSGEIGERIGRPNRQRGDATTNDGYTMFSIGILYMIHQQSCPAW